MHRDVNTLEARRKAQSRELQDIKRELDIQMAAFLHEEADGKDKVSLFQLTFREVRNLLLLKTSIGTHELQDPDIGTREIE